MTEKQARAFVRNLQKLTPEQLAHVIAFAMQQIAR